MKKLQDLRQLLRFLSEDMSVRLGITRPFPMAIIILRHYISANSA